MSATAIEPAGRGGARTPHPWAADLLGAAAGPGSAADAVGGRIALWLSRWQAKEIARLFGVEPRTAKSWRQGCLPQMRHLVAMVDRWGVAFLDDVFAPVLGDLPADLRLERVQRDLDAIQADLAQLARIAARTAASSTDPTGRMPDDARRLPPPALAPPVAVARGVVAGPHGAGALAPEARAPAARPARGRLAARAARLLSGARVAVCLALVCLSGAQLAPGSAVADDLSALRPVAGRSPVRVVRAGRGGRDVA